MKRMISTILVCAPFVAAWSSPSLVYAPTTQTAETPPTLLETWPKPN